MEERKFIKLKKEEFGIKEYIKRDLGKGKISKLDIEYTPVGEKIIIYTNKPGFVIGRRGEKINDLTDVLKKKFKLENPHIEINEIKDPLFDAQSVADEIAMALERMGNLKFKVIAYKKLQEIMKGGALGCELRLSGKLPSDRAKSWRFSEGYLKKAGESRKEVNRAQATALTKTGVIGVKVAIMSPTARIYDRIDIDEKMKEKIKTHLNEGELEETKIKEEKKIKKEEMRVEKTEEIKTKEKRKKNQDKKERKKKIDNKNISNLQNKEIVDSQTNEITQTSEFNPMEDTKKIKKMKGEKNENKE